MDGKIFITCLSSFLSLLLLLPLPFFLLEKTASHVTMYTFLLKMVLEIIVFYLETFQCSVALGSWHVGMVFAGVVMHCG